MFRVIATILAAVLFCIFFTTAAVASADAAPNPLQLGVFFPDPQFPDEQLPSVEDLHDFESSIGRQTDVFLWYESISEDFYADTFLPMAQEGRIIQLAWEPHDFSRPATDQPEYRLARITAGDFDNDIRRWARQLRDFGYPVYFRPMSEMNGDWVTWGGSANGNSPQDYIPAWRHVHDIFVQEGATNVKWVWSPNRDGSTSAAQATFNTYYPGDAYVDFIGINGYNWGTLYNTPDWTSSWQSFEEVIRYSYDVAVANTDKSVVICETATTEVGGNTGNGGKAGWITDAFASLPSRFPRIISLTWFNINKETDWRVQSSAAGLQSFRAAIIDDGNTQPPVLVEAPFAEKWNALGGAPGTALDVAQTITGGKYQDFSNGSLFWNQSTNAVYWVNGEILAKYLAAPSGGGTGGPAYYGLPVSDAYNAWDGKAQNMQKAIITWNSSLGAHAVYGGIMGKYQMLGGPTGPLHLATSDEIDVPGVVPGVTGARMNMFQNGDVYWSIITGGHTINGGIYVRYKSYCDAGTSNCGPNSRLGLPITDEYSIPLPGGGRRSQLQHGFVTWGAWYGTWVDVR
ncbi:MAG: glycosyl hydrolase [Thermoleophilia bacterium]|nr:glycosyl hydrolase [Thermoleophilia bacterium]